MMRNPLKLKLVWYIAEQLENLSVEVIGKSLETNRPKKVVIDSMLVADAVEPFMQQIVGGLNVILERLSPELMMGVYNNRCCCWWKFKTPWN